MTTGLGKQAKTLTDTQLRSLLHYVETATRYPERNRLIVLLSFKAGLRAKEIAGLTWEMVTDAEGGVADAIALQNSASKGKRGGRVIPLHTDLRAALEALRAATFTSEDLELVAVKGFVIGFAKHNMDLASRAATVSYLFNKSWFPEMRFDGATSHSGRRTFITKAARTVSLVGGSLRDVQALAGHSSIAVTQRYVDQDPAAQRRLIDKL